MDPNMALAIFLGSLVIVVAAIAACGAIMEARRNARFWRRLCEAKHESCVSLHERAIAAEKDAIENRKALARADLSLRESAEALQIERSASGQANAGAQEILKDAGLMLEFIASVHESAGGILDAFGDGCGCPHEVCPCVDDDECDDEDGDGLDDGPHRNGCCPHRN